MSNLNNAKCLNAYFDGWNEINVGDIIQCQPSDDNRNEIELYSGGEWFMNITEADFIVDFVIIN